MEVLRVLCCPCRWLQPDCIKDSERQELRRRLHRHRRRRSALQRREERRQEARREEERQSQRAREKILLQQQFRHLYRAERLTSQSGDDGSVAFSSRSSIPPSYYTSSDPHLLDSSPEASPVVQFLEPADAQNTQEPGAGGVPAGQQEREARLAAPHKWVACLPRVDEEPTDEGEDEEEPDVICPAAPARPRSLLAPAPDHMGYYHLKATGQRFSLMNYSEWLCDGAKDALGYLSSKHVFSNIRDSDTLRSIEASPPASNCPALLFSSNG